MTPLGRQGCFRSSRNLVGLAVSSLNSCSRSRVLQDIAARSNFEFDMMSKVKVNVNTLV